MYILKCFLQHSILAHAEPPPYIMISTHLSISSFCLPLHLFHSLHLHTFFQSFFSAHPSQLSTLPSLVTSLKIPHIPQLYNSLYYPFSYLNIPFQENQLYVAPLYSLFQTEWVISFFSNNLSTHLMFPPLYDSTILNNKHTWHHSNISSTLKTPNYKNS